jgi:hypothetical protein
MWRFYPLLSSIFYLLKSYDRRRRIHVPMQLVCCNLAMPVCNTAMHFLFFPLDKGISMMFTYFIVRP